MKALCNAPLMGVRKGGILITLFTCLLDCTISFGQFNTSIDFSPSVVWSSYTGGENYDDAKQIIADYGGSVYAIGMISEGLQTDQQLFLNDYQGGLSDAYITKTNPDGEVQWSLFIGGGSSDFGMALCELPDGNIAAAGYTSSFAGLAVNGVQTTYGGGISDGFVTVLDPNGNLISTSYVGGSGRDVLSRIACAPDGRIFVAGNTSSSALSFNMTHQTTYGGGTSDGLLAEVTDDGEVIWASYVGGSMADYITDIKIASSGDVHFCGRGGASELINTMDTPVLGGGISDGFVGVMQSNGLAWAKYIGGQGYDSFEAIGITPGGATVVAGSTDSIELDGLDTENEISENSSDIVIAVFDPQGEVLWHQYVGGSGNDVPTALDVDLLGNVLLGANTESTDFEVINPLFEAPIGGADMFFSRWNANGIQIWASYFGGLQDDFCTDICFDRFGKIVYAGYTESEALYGTSATSFYQGGWDGLVSKIEDCDNPSVEIHALSDTTFCEGNRCEFCAGGAPHYQWVNSDTLAITETEIPGYVYAIGIRDNGCAGVSNRINVEVLERPVVESTAFGPTVFCGTGTVYMEATGAPVLEWNNGDDGYYTTIDEPGVYYATGTAPNGCRDTSPGIEVIFVEEPTMTLAIGNSDLCIEGGLEALIALPEGGVFAGDGVVGTSFDPLMAGGGTHFVYYQFEDEFGCFSNSDTLEINVYYPPTLLFQAVDSLCLTDAPVDLLGLPVGGFFSGDGIVGESFNPSMSGTGPQNITYTYFDEYGCANNANQVINVDACIGVEELNDESVYFMVYPNPAGDVVNIKFKPHVVYNCTLVSTTGQLMAKWNCQDYYQFNAANFANGMYFLNIESDNWTHTQKVQVSR